jgi:hypothetical protein
MSLDNLMILGVVIALVAVVLGLGAAGLYCLNRAVDQNGR